MSCKVPSILAQIDLLGQTGNLSQTLDFNA